MSNKRLTDLNSITTLTNDDLLYIVDPTFNSSNKITFADLIKTDFNHLSTQFNTVSAEVEVLVGSTSVGLRTDIDALSATFGPNLFPATNLYPLQTRITNLSAEMLTNQANILTRTPQTYSNGVSSNVTILSAFTHTFVNEFNGEIANTIGQNSLTAKQGIDANANTIGQISLTAESGIANAELIAGSTSLTSVNTFNRIGVSQANGTGLQFANPTVPAAAQITDFTSMKDGLRFIPVTIGSDTFRLLLSAV